MRLPFDQGVWHIDFSGSEGRWRNGVPCAADEHFDAERVIVGDRGMPEFRWSASPRAAVASPDLHEHIGVVLVKFTVPISVIAKAGFLALLGGTVFVMNWCERDFFGPCNRSRKGEQKDPK
ncbi:hypothetical protein C4585_03395 [Candidatus Parcubacteria bacterium]|nr:MAG: hypothetical protein C4585_03395 [Candidatus Parcubacteria bacterium]